MQQRLGEALAIVGRAPLVAKLIECGQCARVLARAHAWLYDPAHHDAALTIVEKYTKCDAATAQRVYEQYFLTDKLYTPDAAIDLDGIGRETALLAENGEVPKDKTLDPRQFILAKEQGGMSH